MFWQIYPPKIVRQCGQLSSSPPGSAAHFVMGNDDRPRDPSDESQPKCEKAPLSHQKLKYSFLYYIQLLMIDRVIRVMKVNQNAKK